MASQYISLPCCGPGGAVGSPVEVTNFPALQPISAASLPLPAGASTSALQLVGNASLASIDTKLTSPLTVNLGLTDAELRASAVPVSGAFFQATQPVSGTFFQATQPVSGTFFQATQPVSVASLPLPTGAATSALQTQPGVDIGDVTVNNAGGAFAVNVQDGGNSITVDGTIAATQSGTWDINDISGAISLPAGASTSALQVSGNASLSSIDAKLTAPLSVTGPLTDAELRATPIPVSGTVAVSNFPATQPVSGTVAATQATSPWVVSAASLPLPTGASTAALQTQPGVDIGDVTINNGPGVAAVNIQDGGNSITVDGAFFQATQPVSIAATVAVSGPLTDAELRATAVPISAASLPLPTGASTAANQTSGAQKTQIVDGSGNVISSTANALDVNIQSGVPLTVMLDNATDDVLVYGFDGAVNRAIKTDAAGELQVDVLTSALPSGASTSALQSTGNASLASIDSKLTSPLSVTGPLTDAELRATPVPISGTVTANAGTGTMAVSAVSLPLPAGAATSALQVSGNSSLTSIDSKTPALGQALMAASSPVVIASDQSPIPVTGAFFQATQPVSGTVATTQSGAWTVGLSAGANDIGSVHVLTEQATAADGALGLPAVVKVIGGFDGANVQAIKTDAAGELQVDVLTMPVVQVGDNGGSLTVDGVFFQATQPVSGPLTDAELRATAVPVSGAFFQATQPISGTVTANQGTPNTIANRWPVQGSDGTNSQLYTGTGAALVDGSGVTQPVSAASLPLPSGASTSALQTTGNTSLASIDTNLNSVIAVDGTAVPAKTLMVGGTDGTNIQSLNVDTTGKLNINNISGVVSLPTGAATEATLALLPVSQGGAIAGESGVLAMGSVTTGVPVYTTGQTSPLSLNVHGELRVTQAGTYRCISSATTITHKSGPGILKVVLLNWVVAAGHTMTIYDNTAASGTVIAVIEAGSVLSSSLEYTCEFLTGLTTVTTGTSNWTVVWR